tara:strand:- start:315 stop:647 length:333 start_codon:yes stop_codon:yes gene_type:complete
MTQLDLKIKIYLQNNSKNYDDERSNFSLRDDGSGAYIEVWNVSGVSKPTDEQLNALESEATKLENNNKIRATRKSLYGDIGDQLDEIFKDIDTWKARIQKIKDDNPKESS